MLPETLIWLLNAALIHAASSSLSLNSLTSFNTNDLPSPPTFSLPAAQNLTITVAFCSSGSSPARFFVTNSSSVDDPGPSGGTDVYEISVNDGLGTFSGVFTSGGVFAVDTDNSASFSFQVGTSDNAPIHEITEVLPHFGDTTSNQALLLSPPFDPLILQEPSYPNYTLPGPSLTPPTPPSSSPNFTLIMQPTSSQTLTNLPQTACALDSQSSTGNIANESLWLLDENGWRTQWVVEGLNAQTNYTAYVIQDSQKVSGPIYFATKSAAFSCPIAAFLPYCPSVTWAVPLPFPQTNLAIIDNTNIPSNISDTLTAYLSNFTTSLLTQACGRDFYSPLQTCSDCQQQYFRWLCAISFPRCGETSPTTTTTPMIASTSSSTATAITSALQTIPSSSSSRNPTFPSFNSSYTVLLPCIETCQAADRACPNFLGFNCPLARFNANSSYGVGYIDGADPDMEGLGVPGYAQDRYGNVWCNYL